VTGITKARLDRRSARALSRPKRHVSGVTSSLTKASDAFQDGVGGLGPNEWFGNLILDSQITPERSLQLGGTAMRSAAQLSFSQRGEPALDHIGIGEIGFMQQFSPPSNLGKATTNRDVTRIFSGVYELLAIKRYDDTQARKVQNPTASTRSAMKSGARLNDLAHPEDNINSALPYFAAGT
jgi:hypothetical protein